MLALLAGLLSTAFAIAQAPDDLRIVYLANEGFLLQHGETKVLVDALFGEGIEGYAALPAARRTALESGQPPYDGIDVALASHYHADHFDAAAVARFLTANPDAIFVSTEQAVDALHRIESAVPEIDRRVFGHRLREGEVFERSFGDVDLSLHHLHHGRTRPDIQNLGLVVEICDLTVLHVGDTEADAAEMRRAGLADLAPDVALLPSWFLREGPWEGVVDAIRPRRIVAMHLPTRSAPANYFWGEARRRDELVSAIVRRHPGTFVPETPGEFLELTCP